MSRTRQAPQTGPRDAPIIQDRDLAGPHGGHEIAATDDRGRRWYQLRAEPRRRTDFMGLKAKWWMALGWLVVLIVVAFPFPWWW
jgi:hypothetical protein